MLSEIAIQENEQEIFSQYPALTKKASKILDFSDPILRILSKIKEMSKEQNPDFAKEWLTQKIINFEKSSKSAGVPISKVLKVKYILCAAIDDIILQSQWGKDNRWYDYSLLSSLLNDTNGGYHVFTILDDAMHDKKFNLDILEVIYFCLCLGFSGKYRIQEDGETKLLRIRQDVWSTLRSEKAVPSFFINSESKKIKKSNKLLKFYKSSLPIFITLIFLTSIWGYYKIHLYHESNFILNILKAKIYPDSQEER